MTLSGIRCIWPRRAQESQQGGGAGGRESTRRRCHVYTRREVMVDVRQGARLVGVEQEGEAAPVTPQRGRPGEVLGAGAAGACDGQGRGG